MSSVNPDFEFEFDAWKAAVNDAGVNAEDYDFDNRLSGPFSPFAAAAPEQEETTSDVEAFFALADADAQSPPHPPLSWLEPTLPACVFPVSVEIKDAVRIRSDKKSAITLTFPWEVAPVNTVAGLYTFRNAASARAFLAPNCFGVPNPTTFIVTFGFEPSTSKFKETINPLRFLTFHSPLMRENGGRQISFPVTFNASLRPTECLEDGKHKGIVMQLFVYVAALVDGNANWIMGQGNASFKFRSNSAKQSTVGHKRTDSKF